MLAAHLSETYPLSLVLAVLGDQLSDLGDVRILRGILRQALLLFPGIPLVLALEVEHSGTSWRKQSLFYNWNFKKGREAQLFKNIRILTALPVFTSPTVPCLKRAYSSNSSSSDGVVFNCFTSSAAASKFYTNTIQNCFKGNVPFKKKHLDKHSYRHGAVCRCTGG